MVVYRRDTRRRGLLLMLVATSVVLVTIDSRGSGFTGSIRTAARDIIAPVQNVVDDAFTPISDAVSGVTSYGAVREENERLKRELAEAQGKLDRERAVGSEVGELEKLLDLPTIEDATGVAARVVGGAVGNLERTVQINKGASKGITVGQPVVAGNGLVGRVTHVASESATVTLIDAPGFGIGVRLENTNERGIAEGRTGEREMRLNFLSPSSVTGKPLPACTKDASPDTCVSLGELVFTSAVEDAAFPPDIPVAKVTEVSKKPGELERTITLRPLVELDDLTYLKVLRWPERAAA